MFSTISSSFGLPHPYFENSLGRLLEHPTGHYIAIEYYPGSRQLADLPDFLTHAGQLLARWGWDKLLVPQTIMPAFTPEEIEWVTAQWVNQVDHSAALLYGAQLLPHELFARLSWRSHEA